jgi:hypothetical protein
VSLSVLGIGTCCSATSRGSSGGGIDWVPVGDTAMSALLMVLCACEMSDGGATRVYALDILARFLPRSAESREEGLSVGELEPSGLRGAIVIRRFNRGSSE